MKKMVEMGESYHKVYETAIRGLENIQEETKGYLDQAKELLKQAKEQTQNPKPNNQEQAKSQEQNAQPRIFGMQGQHAQRGIAACELERDNYIKNGWEVI
jgi:dsDNA-binding SOS-regulon protein